METEIVDFFTKAPRWMQIQLQFFLQAWTSAQLEHLEHGTAIPANLPEQLSAHDPHLEHQPTKWLAEWQQKIEKIHPGPQSADALQTFAESWEALIRDQVSADILIFPILVNGESVTDAEWSRLEDTVAFREPPVDPSALSHHHQGPIFVKELGEGPAQPPSTAPTTNTPSTTALPNQKRISMAKTRRVIGRRAITPIRRKGRKTRLQRKVIVEKVSGSKIGASKH